MKWSNRRSAFFSVRFVSFFHVCFGLRPPPPLPLLFVSAPPPFSKRTSRNFLPSLSFQKRRASFVFRGASALNCSLSITFDIGYERLTDYVDVQRIFPITIFTSCFRILVQFLFFFQNPFLLTCLCLSPSIYCIYRVPEALNSPWIILRLFRACRVHLAGWLSMQINIILLCCHKWNYHLPS
jgi:hypothetical protein